MRVLLLGGTSEARALAARLHPDIEVISSLAGRVPDPALPVGAVRIGGFGGSAGLVSWLKRTRSTPSSMPPIRTRRPSPAMPPRPARGWHYRIWCWPGQRGSPVPRW